MLQFHNTEFQVSGIKMLCQSISVDEQSSLTPIYAIGYKGSPHQSPSGPTRTSISTSYYCEITGDICNTLIGQIKNYDFNSAPITIAIAGKTGSAYLTRYSLSCQPNKTISASADYDVYHELSGNYSSQNTSIINQSNGSGFAHFWSAYPKNHDGTLTGSLISFNYSCGLNWQPIYKIGRNTPIEVKFIKGTEEFSFSHEVTGLKITYSGQNVEDNIPSFHKIELYPLSFAFGVNTNNKIVLYPASGKLISNKINIQEDNTIINETTVNKYF